MERYYGPLQAIPKKMHTSIVGCLRNQRNTKKKLLHETQIQDIDVTRDPNENQAN